MFKNIKSQEEEVKLRLQFESKLNSLHSLHRDLQAKYERSLDDIYKLEQIETSLKERCERYESELVELRSMKIEQESKIIYQGEKLKGQELDNERKNKAYQVIEAKMVTAQKTIAE